MEPKKVSAQQPAQKQLYALPELTPNAEFNIKTKLALASALAGKNYTKEEGEAALKKSIAESLAKPSKAEKFVQERVESLKQDYANVKNPVQAAKVTWNRTMNGFDKMNEATGLPIKQTWALGAAYLTGGAVLKAGGQAIASLSNGLTASQAVSTVGVLAGSAALASCGAELPGEEHNHFIENPPLKGKTDTVIFEKPIYIHKTDTFIKEVPGPVIHDTIINNIHDTTFIDRPGPPVHDTTYIDRPYPMPMPPETIYVNRDFVSKVPPKMKEMAEDLGAEISGNGKFVHAMDYQDQKNNQVHRQIWDGGRTSRDGDVYVMNEIKTGWQDSETAPGYVFGKNEQFQKNEFYLSNNNLANSPNTPLSPINASNGNNEPNWWVFNPGQPSAEPGNWVRNNSVTYQKLGSGEWQTSDGFNLKRGEKPGEIIKTNSHGSEWKLVNVKMHMSDDSKDPQ